MKHIGEQALTFGLPVIVNGSMAYMDSDHYQGQWVGLCFVPHLGHAESELLDRQALEMRGRREVLLEVPA